MTTSPRDFKPLTAARTLRCSLVLQELGIADRIYSLFVTLDGLVGAGALGRSDAERWSGELRTADRAGQFFSSYTGFLASGIRPHEVRTG